MQLESAHGRDVVGVLLFQDLAVGNHDDAIGRFDCGEAVRDYETGAAAEDPSQPLLNQTFGPWMRDQAVMLAVGPQFAKQRPIALTCRVLPKAIAKCQKPLFLPNLL